ncbi:MAG: MaoC family dehydratase N-terminal domain-containing protein [Pusillimonas sp.]
MTILPETAKAFIGKASTSETTCDPVERGAVRRYAQAIMDEDPIFWSACEDNARFGGPVAPLLYPTYLFRRPFGAPDPLQLNANNPNFDGAGQTALQGLPEIESLKSYSLLNGGSEVEFFSYARHGETITLKSRYADIVEKETSKGPMVFVIIESEYRSDGGRLLIRARRTLIRRKT